MPTPKVGLFGTFSKIDPKIWKISKFQTVVEIALVNGFRWNLCQMEALGSNFQDFLEFWIFINFSMFSTYLNVDQIRIFGNYRKCKNVWFLGKKCEIWVKMFLQPFFSVTIFYNYNRSKVVHIFVNHIFRFSIFSRFPYINSLMKWWWKSENPYSW